MFPLMLVLLAAKTASGNETSCDGNCSFSPPPVASMSRLLPSVTALSNATGWQVSNASSWRATDNVSEQELAASVARELEPEVYTSNRSGLTAYSDFSPSPFLGVIGEAVPVPLPYGHRGQHSLGGIKFPPTGPKPFLFPPEGQVEHAKPLPHYEDARPVTFEEAKPLMGFAVQIKPGLERPVAGFGQDVSGPGFGNRPTAPEQIPPLFQNTRPDLEEEKQHTAFEEAKRGVETKPDKFDIENTQNLATTTLESQRTREPHNMAAYVSKILERKKKKEAWKALMKVIATILPLGLFVAALHPNVLYVNSTQSGAVPRVLDETSFRGKLPAEFDKLGR